MVRVCHWACYLQQHSEDGEHYHVSGNLSIPRWWKAVRDLISARHGINLNFSDVHHNYFAYRYVVKAYQNVCLSPGHPNFSTKGSPKTNKCTKAYCESFRKRKFTDASSGHCEPCLKSSSGL